MASTRKKKANRPVRKNRRPNRREPRSGTLRSTLDPRTKRGPEKKPLTGSGPNRPGMSGEQSGDLEGLETDESEGNESVRELADEGQDLEAEKLEGFGRSRITEPSAPLRPRPVPDHREPPFKDRNRI